MYISCIELTSTKHVEKSTSRTPGELVSKRVIRALRSRQTYKHHVMISSIIINQLVVSFIFHSRDNQLISFPSNSFWFLYSTWVKITGNNILHGFTSTERNK